MKLISFEEGEEKIKKTEYASATIKIVDNENIIYKKYEEDLFKIANNQFSFLIQHLNSGDSCVFKVSKSKLLKEFKGLVLSAEVEMIDIIIKVHNFYDESEFLDKAAELDKEMLEQVLLKKYLDEVKATEYNGIFKEVLKEGIGDKVVVGDNISITYKGYFINRLEFDNRLEELPFTFTYGTPDQVIKGLENAIISMREGEKSKIIITSQLAFGEEGSTTLIVPPFTTVIYELEILKIKNKR